jgi:hypothetical protein
MQDRLGRRIIRAECSVCRQLLDHPLVVEPYVSMANTTKNPTAALDVLIQLQEMGIELCSDGRAVWVPGEHYRLVSADLRATIRQCCHELARMIGNNQPQQTT